MLRAALALTALVVVTGCAGSKEPPRDAAGHVTAAGTVRADHIRVGDCYDDQGQASVRGFPVVPCARPHDNEVFFLFDADGDAYPGPDELTQVAISGCSGNAFTAYVGTALADSALRAFEVVPTKDTWVHDHDRQIICGLTARSRGKLNGSAKDAAQ
jgi:hypothetical protein